MQDSIDTFVQMMFHDIHTDQKTAKTKNSKIRTVKFVTTTIPTKRKTTTKRKFKSQKPLQQEYFNYEEMAKLF